MKYPEENYARDLHNQLSSIFKPVMPGTAVSITGRGVHWDVTAEFGSRLCKIHCFDVRGPEYLISFQQSSQEVAMGRTPSNEDAIAAVTAWLEGKELSDLHARFQFVDGQKRALENIRARVFAHCPELQQALVAEMQHKACDLYELWFRAGDRSCRIYYYGKNEFPDAIFNWDECPNFSFKTGDLRQLALVLSRWLSARVMPSDLCKEFPWIELRKVAEFYEQGRGIEGEFVESWDNIERFYAEMNFPLAEEIRQLVSEMRRCGYDHNLRAGQSMYTLIVSRSRRHGLRKGQPHISFQFRQEGMDVQTEIQGAETVSIPRIGLTKEIEDRLNRLAAETVT